GAYDHVVVWDRQTGATKVLNTAQRLATTLQSMVLDNSSQFAALERGDFAGSYIWQWSPDTLSPLLGNGLPYAFAAHKVVGSGQISNPGLEAGSWVIRPLATPETFSKILVYPTKNDRDNYFEGSDSSRLLANQSFFQTRYVAGFSWLSVFTPYAGGIYQLSGYLASSANFGVPEAVRYE